MLVRAELVLWVMTVLLAFTTVFFNGYILLTSVRSYRQTAQWSPSETIILALALADIAHQLVCYFWMTVDQVDRECRMDQVLYRVTLLLIYSLKFTIMWDTGFLTFYYSTKLVTVPNRCYTQIQASILKHVTLAVSLIPLCGVGTCMPMMVVFKPDNHTGDHDECGILVPNTDQGKAYKATYLILADVLPGVLMVKCCASISVHLAVHLRNMKASTNGAHGPKLGSQMRVIRMALSLVAVFIVFLVVDLYAQYRLVVSHDNIIMLTFFFTSIYTTVVATTLIYGKKTLWKALVREFNASLDGTPCLPCLKVPEQKKILGSPARGTGTEGARLEASRSQ